MGSFRVSSFEDQLGVGYYWMEDQSTSHLFTLLLNKRELGSYPFLPPYPIDKEGIISKRNLIYSNREKNEFQFKDILSGFTKSQFSSIVYSVLTGDNILIVDLNAEKRMKLIQLLLSVLPSPVFEYNRITSGCAELDGNENIVGLDILPKKYRSAKKLFLPIDTIFVDLTNKTVEGDGVKTCNITDNLSDLIFASENQGYEEIDLMFKLIKKEKFEISDDILNEKFIERIQIKLGMKPKIKEEWMMF